MNIIRRPRRNRANSVIRRLVQDTFLPVSKLIYPLFIIGGESQKIEISSMPGIYRFSLDNILKEIGECVQLGIHTFILFPVIDESLKDTVATISYDPNNLYLKAIRSIKEKFPDIVIVTDVAMDPYNSDGHDGLVKNGEILNDETLTILGKMAIEQAKAGADILGPSDMMDGRIGYLREILDNSGFKNISLMSYTAKYASSFYGPFREALDSAPKAGDKKTYQMDYNNSRDALIEAELDTIEGADYLMVKPALSYLDIIYKIKAVSALPVVAYNVSGEYSMIKAAGMKGWLDEERVMIEMLHSIKRAGADIIITYFAKQFARICND